MLPVILANQLDEAFKPLSCSMEMALFPLWEKPLIGHTLDALTNFKRVIIFSLRPQTLEKIIGNQWSGIALSFFTSPSGIDFHDISAEVLPGPLEGGLEIFMLQEDTLEALLAHENHSGADVQRTIAGSVPSPQNYSGADVPRTIAGITPSPQNYSGVDVQRTIAGPPPAQTNPPIRGTSLPAQANLQRDLAVRPAPAPVRMALGWVRGSWGEHRSLEGIYSRKSYPEAIVKAPAYIAPNVTIEAGAVVEAGTVILEGAVIKSGAKLHGALIMAGAFIGEGARVNAAIIGPGAKVMEKASVYENCIVGQGCILGRGSEVEPGVRLWPGRELPPEATAAFDLRFGPAVPPEAFGPRFLEEGVMGDIKCGLSPQNAVRLGGGMALVGPEKRPILVGWDSKTPAAMSLGLGLAAGITAGGREVWLAGALSPGVFRHALFHHQLAGCYAQGIAGLQGVEGSGALIQAFSVGGLPLTLKESLTLERAMISDIRPIMEARDFGIISETPSLDRAYTLFLRGILGGQHLQNVSFSCPDRELSALANALFDHGAPHNDSAPLVVYLSADGSAARFYTKETGYIPWDKVLLLGCMDFFANKRPVALPFSTPSAADILAKKYGQEPLRYHISSRGADEKARDLALKQTFPRDGLETTLRLLLALAEGEGSGEHGWGRLLKEALARLPAFDTATRYLPIHPAHTTEKVLSRLAQDAASCPEGILTRTEKGRVLLRPARSGRGIMVFAESFMSESAEELCSFYEMIIAQSK